MSGLLTANQYISLYYIVLAINCIVFILIKRKLGSNVEGLIFLSITSFFFMALRPLSGLFTDMLNYNSVYNDLMTGELFQYTNDIGFEYYMRICSFFLPSELWFALTALIYMIGYVRLYNVLVGRSRSFYIFLFLYASFFFWSYGTNTIRAGMANSILMLAFSYYLQNKKKSFFFLAILAVSIHNSMLLIIVSAIIALSIKSNKWYYSFWGLCVVLSFFLGSYLMGKFAHILIFDDRFANYITKRDEIGNVFRWDFLLFSALPVAWTYYLKKYFNYKNSHYCWITRIYLLSNAFWILVIRAAFSDRFAFMSWSFIPILLAYPLLDKSISIPHKITYYKSFLFIIFSLTLFLYLKKQN